jgi:hypothetical protein
MADTNSTLQLHIFKDPIGNILATTGFYSLPFPKHIPLLRHLHMSASAESRAPKESGVDFSQEGLSDTLFFVRTRMPFCRGAKQGYESSDC